MDEATGWPDRRSKASRWIPDDVPPHAQWTALLRLAAATRSLIDHLTSTDAATEELGELARTVEGVVQRLEAAPGGRNLWGFAETATSGNARAMFDNSPIVGMANPIAPPMRVTFEDGLVRGTVVFGKAYEGPPGHVHGGFVAAVMDDGLGMVQALTERPGMTGTLTVRYRRPTPLYREIVFEGRVDRVEGRKIFTTAMLKAGDVVCAEAEGLFVSVDFERMRALAEDG